MKFIIGALILAFCFALVTLPAGAQVKPITVNLYYNNYHVPGQVFMVGGSPYLSIDSIRTLFPHANISDSSQGVYMINGKAVNIYHYNDHLYLDTDQTADALGLVPKYFRDKLEIIFIEKKQYVQTLNIPANPPIRIDVADRATGVSSDPVNSSSRLYRLGLTNTGQKLYNLNYYNFLLIGNSGNKYTSVNNIKYTVVWGDNDHGSNVFLDPNQRHEVEVNFNIPSSDSPRTLVILQGKEVLGYVTL